MIRFQLHGLAGLLGTVAEGDVTPWLAFGLGAAIVVAVLLTWRRLEREQRRRAIEPEWQRWIRHPGGLGRASRENSHPPAVGASS